MNAQSQCSVHLHLEEHFHYFNEKMISVKIKSVHCVVPLLLKTNSTQLFPFTTKSVMKRWDKGNGYLITLT